MKTWSRVLGVVALLAIGLLVDTRWIQGARAQDGLAPLIAVFVEQNSVIGCHWPVGTVLTLTVDDPATPDSIDYQDTRIVEADPDPFVPGSTAARFWPGEAFTIQPGHIVTLSGGGETRTHTVTSLTVDGADMTGDRLWGTAAPGSIVEVRHYSQRDVVRYETAGADGNWLADFSIAGDEPEEALIHNFNEATRFMVMQSNGGGHTQIDWQAPNPMFAVDTAANHVHGHGWPDGVPVTLTIDDPGTDLSPDYADTQMSAAEDGDTVVRFWPGEVFEIQPGHLVTLTDGILTKEHTVTSLIVTGFDGYEDQIWGIAEPGTQVVAKLFHDTSIIRWETAGGDGNWSADFSVPGDEPGEEKTYDMGAGTRLMVYQEDSDADRTQMDWRAPIPMFEVEFTQNTVAGSGWPLGAVVSLAIDDPSNGPGVDYSDMQTSQPDDWDPNVSWVSFVLGDAFRLRPTQIVTLSWAGLVKTHVVANLSVTAVDFEGDIVSGMAEPGSDLRISYTIGRGATTIQQVQRWEQADDAGDWSASFGVPGDEDQEQVTVDILPIVPPGGTAHQYDDDGDSTQVTWPIHQSVSVDGDSVWGSNWFAGDEVTLTIDDPDTPETPDYTGTATPQSGPWFLSQVNFDLHGLFDVKPDHVVTLSQGAVTKVHVVTQVSVTAVDVDAETVTGTATPGAHIYVTLGQNEANRHEIADSAGNWFADFSVFGDENYEQYTFDIQPESRGQVEESDDDGDGTSLGWQLPFPPTGEITSPGEGEVVFGTANFGATYSDDDPSGVQWAVRYNTCAAGTNTVWGNVDGHNDPFTWNGSAFLSQADTSDWTPGHYCFVFNPTEGPGEDDMRLTRLFEVIPPPPVEVIIDIKPGSEENPINLGSKGVVPVAIFSTDDFDATTVIPESIKLGGASVAIRGKGTLLFHEEDINGDGLMDIVVQVNTADLGFTPGEGVAILTGETTGGLHITGTDTISIVPPE